MTKGVICISKFRLLLKNIQQGCSIQTQNTLDKINLRHSHGLFCTKSINIWQYTLALHIIVTFIYFFKHDQSPMFSFYKSMGVSNSNFIFIHKTKIQKPSPIFSLLSSGHELQPDDPVKNNRSYNNNTSSSIHPHKKRFRNNIHVNGPRWLVDGWFCYKNYPTRVENKSLLMIYCTKYLAGQPNRVCPGLTHAIRRLIFILTYYPNLKLLQLTAISTQSSTVSTIKESIAFSSFYKLEF